MSAEDAPGARAGAPVGTLEAGASSQRRKDVYFSCDVETDGPTPSLHSLVSVGMVELGRAGRDGFTPSDLDADGYYRELVPVTDLWVPEALAVSGLTREQLLTTGTHPRTAMEDLVEWIAKTSGQDRPVFVAYPAAFDWRWVSHYLEVYAGENPFGFSGVLDLKSVISAHLGLPLRDASKRRLPKSMRSHRPHTHNALDDAREQGEVAQNLLSVVMRPRT